MSSLKEKISTNLKKAMKEKNSFIVSALRMLLSQIHNAEIEKRGELSEDELLKIIQKEIKKRKEAFEIYKKGGADDLALTEEKEIEIFQKYLPPLLSKEEIENLVKETIIEIGASGSKDIGRVIGRVTERAKGRVEGNLVAAIVKKNLSQ